MPWPERAADPKPPYFSALLEVWLLLLRAMLAQARGDGTEYRELRSGYRALAESLGFEGHIAWAKAMP